MREGDVVANRLCRNHRVAEGCVDLLNSGDLDRTRVLSLFQTDKLIELVRLVRLADELLVRDN